MKLTWLGHSAFSIKHKDANILIDPFLKGNPTFKLNFDEVIQGVTHIIITHGHQDHIGDAIEISKLTGAKVIANFDLCMYLLDKGLKNYDPMNSGGTTDQGDFFVSFTNAVHSSAHYEDGVSHSLGSANGIILRLKDSKTIYHMGDTDIFSDMALISEFYRPDIGIVPIGNRFTMGAELAAFACRKFFAFDTVIPCHYATFPLLVQTADLFKAKMKGSSMKVVVPDMGETIDL
jgi:L-ascorbate metabolism protein UlaG (beta-lactamase superfamily)